LPAPLLNNMYGFRFSQREMLVKLLSADCSGCLKAPTRYGKSTLIVNTMRAYPGITTVFTCPGEDLLRQSVKDYKEALPDRDIRLLGAGSSNRISGPDITVCSMDSLHLCDHGKVRLLIIDEPHALMTDGRIPELNKFQMARRLSFGATLEGRFDQRDLVLEGLLGPVLAERTYLEAVAEGAICPLVIILLKVRMSRQAVGGKREMVYKHTVFENPEMANMVAAVCKTLPEDWQHLIFIKQEVQADHIQEALGDDTPIAMAKVLKKKVRAQLAQDMRYNQMRRCIASDIFSTGITLHSLQCVVNASGAALRSIFHSGVGISLICYKSR
jgi:superfamily II DNA or RNA helicase